MHERGYIGYTETRFFCKLRPAHYPTSAATSVTPRRASSANYDRLIIPPGSPTEAYQGLFAYLHLLDRLLPTANHSTPYIGSTHYLPPWPTGPALKKSLV
ncbi:hypothetical protein NDU88_001817 [Pleurodeles waltl]|uniref:Uncharacterized protein n=1 Tax=Pleurodeles waltl TaxID=8319 RepID=A0AAV7WMP5_PLEWA|nr:hypothetical protein NDU88_001817 [Pleurodeles waltl]